MRKTLLIIMLTIIYLSCSAQMSEYYKRPTISGKIELINGTGNNMLVFICDTTAGGMMFKSTRNIPNGTLLRTAISNGWLVVNSGGSGGSGSMTYPGSGIPLSTGSAWGTSITNNSANWNTAYSWGNHATAGYLTNYTETDPNVPSWAKQLTKPPYTYSEVGASASNHNHSGVYQPVGSYLTSESDPTVPDWAKQSTKPPYTFSEVGAAPSFQSSTNGYSWKYISGSWRAWPDSVGSIIDSATLETRYNNRWYSIAPCVIDSFFISTSRKYSIGYIERNITIDSVIVLCNSLTTTNVTPKLFYGSDMSASGTAIITSPSAVTTSNTPVRYSSFNNSSINGGSMLWLTFTDKTTPPRSFFIKIVAHKR